MNIHDFVLIQMIENISILSDKYVIPNSPMQKNSKSFTLILCLKVNVTSHFFKYGLNILIGGKTTLQWKKSGKHYLSQVVKININSDKLC